MIVLSGCNVFAQPTCAEQSSEYLEQSEQLILQFEDKVELAQFTPPGQWSNIVPDMQRIKREVLALDVPDCAVPARDALVNHLTTVITVHLAVLDGQPVGVINQIMRMVTQSRDNYRAELDKLTELENREASLN